MISRIVYRLDSKAEICKGASESKEEITDSEKENRPKIFQYVETVFVSILSDSFSKVTKAERTE